MRVGRYQLVTRRWFRFGRVCWDNSTFDGIYDAVYLLGWLELRIYGRGAGA